LFEYSFLIKKILISRLDAKRLIGRMFEDSTVQSDMKHWPFDVISDGGKPKIQVDYKGEQKTFFPEEISSMVLQQRVNNAVGPEAESACSMTPLTNSD
jgi:L1 cell adhesion molecule like protein